MCSIAIDQPIRLSVSSTINSGLVFESARKVASRGEAAYPAKGQSSAAATATAATATTATAAAAAAAHGRSNVRTSDAAAVVGNIGWTAAPGAVAAEDSSWVRALGVSWNTQYARFV